LPIRVGELWNAGNSFGTSEQDVSSRDVEKPRNVGRELRLPIAFPRYAAVEAELSRLANSTDHSNDCPLHGVSIDTASDCL
jgi:hypothetical protein